MSWSTPRLIAAFALLGALLGVLLWLLFAKPYTELELIVWPFGPQGAAVQKIIVCDKDDLSRDCRFLEQVSQEDLNAVPADRVCTDVYGGPQQVVMQGRLNNEDVAASFSLDDGCQVARWEKLEPFLGLLVTAAKRELTPEDSTEEDPDIQVEPVHPD
jgi:hypothetical protein